MCIMITKYDNERNVSNFKGQRGWFQNIELNEELEEGYFLVTLKNSKDSQGNKRKTYFYAPKNKLISMRGFDETYGVEVEQGEILIPVIIDNKEYVIHEDDDGIFYIYEKYYKNTLRARVKIKHYDEDPNGTIEELNVC